MDKRQGGKNYESGAFHCDASSGVGTAGVRFVLLNIPPLLVLSPTNPGHMGSHKPVHVGDNTNMGENNYNYKLD